jgi:tRNA threonylcarbamoyl adenosine modification protein (Sua5/YciO/YrdC/YwlC family)
MLLKIHPASPESRNLNKVVECLNDGGVIIYPTDTVYGLGCDIYNRDAVERVYKIKGIKPEFANLSFICFDFSHLSDFTKQIDTPVFRVMRKALPGPFTFILKANSNVPKLFKSRKKTVGIRIPENSICRAIVKRLGHPIVSTSIHDDDKIIDYTTNPEMIHEKYNKIVDMVVDGGFGKNVPSTVIDCSDGSFTVVRKGLGDIEQYL